MDRITLYVLIKFLIYKISKKCFIFFLKYTFKLNQNNKVSNQKLLKTSNSYKDKLIDINKLTAAFKSI